MKTENVFALVTGAGKGLGKAIAFELASKGHNVLLLALEGEGLSLFRENLQSRFKVEVKSLEVDFLHPNALATIEKWLRDVDINILVNNAGIGGTVHFENSDMDFIDAIIQVNIRMLAMMTRLVFTKLRVHAESYILNVSSMASCCPIAYKTVYPASKAFVYSFSKSLAHELKSLGVHVCVLLPGPIKTNGEVSERIEQQGWWVKAGLLTPECIAFMAVRAMFKKRKVLVPGFVSKVNWLLLKTLPERMCVPIISNAMKSEIHRATPLV